MNYVKKFIFISIMFLSFNITCFAITKEQGNNIATFAKEMILKGNERKDKDGYPLLAYLSHEERLDGWNGKLRYLENVRYYKYTENGKTKYVNGYRWVFNCDSFVSYVLYHTYGIKVVDDSGKYPWTVSVYDRNAKKDNIVYFVDSKSLKFADIDYSKMQPGDIILCYSAKSGDTVHIVLYIGDGMIAHASTTHLTGDVVKSKTNMGLQVVNFKERYGSFTNYRYKILRVKDDAITKKLDMSITWPDTGEVEILGNDNKPVIENSIINKNNLNLTFKDDKALVGYNVSLSKNTPITWLKIDNKTSYQANYQLNQNGTYYIFIKDSKGQITTESIVVSSFPIINKITSIYNEKEKFDIFIEGNNLLYSLDGVNFKSTNSFLDLDKKSYIIYAKNKDGLVSNKNIDLTDSNLPNITLENKEENNKFNLVIKIESKNQIKGYNVSKGYKKVDNWKTGNYSNIIHEISENGTYYVYVIDSNNVSYYKTITINEIKNTADKLINSIIYTYNQDDTYNIEINLKENNIVTYSIDDIKYQEDNTFLNLKKEKYILCLKDKDGNVFTKEINLSDDYIPNISVDYKKEYTRNLNLQMNFQSISGISGYAILREKNEPSSWLKGDNFNYSITENGTYYIWAKSNDGIPNCLTIEINNIDTIPPIFKTAKQIDKNKVEIIATDDMCGVYGYSLDGINYQKENILNVSDKEFSLYIKDNCDNVDIYNVKIKSNNYLIIIFIVIIILIIVTIILVKMKLLKKSDKQELANDYNYDEYNLK